MSPTGTLDEKASATASLTVALRALLTSCDEAVVLTVGRQVGPREFAGVARELAPGGAPSDSDDRDLAGVGA